MPVDEAASLRETLAQVAQQYSRSAVTFVAGDTASGLQQHMLESVLKTQFEITLVARAVGAGARVGDVGGGISLLAPSLATLGYRCLLVDDFADRWHQENRDALEIHRKAGVEIHSADITADSFELENETFDAIVSFDVIEHLHNSPRRLLQKLVAALRPGGVLVIGTPNCVNLRKRITTPLGIGKWSLMSEWYDAPTFRGHVREPDVKDLQYIAKDLGLADWEIIGRNWLGYTSRFALVRVLTPIADRVLRLRPSLCANLYLVGRRPLRAGDPPKVGRVQLEHGAI
jgi:2-polyprenyl-3-methyl-5-hydroxy-6-metoxy-1,4-benzoquinol methylase